MATLFIASGPNDGRWFPIGKKSLVVGRDEGLLAQVVDEGVSRRHLTIRYDPATGHYFAADLDSRNGVFVNDRKLTAEVSLRDDDLIRIGDTLLLFSTSDFEGDDNALRHYRQRDQRIKETLKLGGGAAAAAREELQRMEREKGKV